jgi:hypothetical protein
MTYSIDTAALQRLRGARWSGVAPTVYALGLTSMLTDVASQMVTATVPLYFMFALQLTRGRWLERAAAAAAAGVFTGRGALMRPAARCARGLGSARRH